MAGKNYKISICTVCMNRLHHLKQTVVRNIKDNEFYGDIEFILLDYNSQDGMEEWVKENLTEYINTNKLIYFKTLEPDAWNPSHSKNLAFRLATGDIVCNIWSDYFTGENFADFVNFSFRDDPNIVMTPIDFHKTKPGFYPPGDVLGKVCVRKNDFLHVGGFDERIDKHGFEDHDFVNRLELLGLRRVLIDDFSYLQYLPHDDSERYTPPSVDLDALYVCYIDPSRSECLLLLKNGSFQKGILIDNYSINSEDFKNSFSRKIPLYQFSIEG